MLQGEVAVGHAGNIISDAAVKSVAFNAVAGFATEVFGMMDEKVEQRGDHPRSCFVRTSDLGAVVEVLEQMPAQPGEFLAGWSAKGC